ncbi:MAG TPA: hypothetical protein VGE77_11545 [Nocardioides sp.]
MRTRSRRLALLAAGATLTVLVAGCGDESDAGDGESPASASTSADDADTSTAEGAYDAWRASILDDDADAFDAVSIDAAWSDIVESTDNEGHHAALVEAAADGDLELPTDPEAEVGRDAVLAASGDDEPWDDAAWDEFTASITEEFDVDIDDVASFVVPFGAASGGEADALFVRSTDDGWLFFGMEPAS